MFPPFVLFPFVCSVAFVAYRNNLVKEKTNQEAWQHVRKLALSRRNPIGREITGRLRHLPVAPG
jgi:hypothetical protein